MRMRRALSAAVVAALLLPATASASFVEDGSFDISAAGRTTSCRGLQPGRPHRRRDSTATPATCRCCCAARAVASPGRAADFVRRRQRRERDHADFNGDGWQDVALGFNGSPDVSVLAVATGTAARDHLVSTSARAQTNVAENAVAPAISTGTRPTWSRSRSRRHDSMLLRNAVGNDFLTPTSFAGTRDRPARVAVGRLQRRRRPRSGRVARRHRQRDGLLGAARA